MMDFARTGKRRWRRVLVTGGAGFIGANLVRTLLEYGHEVTVLDNLSTGRLHYLRGLPVEFIQGDVLDVATLDRVVPRHDSVVHLAAQTSVEASVADPLTDCQTNVIGTLNLLDACRRAMASASSSHAHPLANDNYRFVFASSNAVFGRQLLPAVEDKAPLPTSPYGASKLAGEAYSLAYHGSWGIETVVLRFANAYGPFSLHKNSVIHAFIKDAMTTGRITIHGDGQQTRDFIYVADVCRALMLALNGAVTGEIFQVATGVETSIQDLATTIGELSGRPLELHYGRERRGECKRNYSNVSKAERLLNWAPRVTLRQGLWETWQWFEDELRKTGRL